MEVPDILTAAEAALRLRCPITHASNAIKRELNGVSSLPALAIALQMLILAAALEMWLAENGPASSRIVTDSQARNVQNCQSCGLDGTRLPQLPAARNARRLVDRWRDRQRTPDAREL
jgi:hypothetical protein